MSTGVGPTQGALQILRCIVTNFGLVGSLRANYEPPKTIFLTNDEDQNSAASEMPTTLTVTYAVIVACVIETRTVFRPARS